MERALLVNCIFNGKHGVDWAEDSMQELKHLALSAGAEVVSSVTQQRESPNTRYFLGRGKVSYLADMVSRNKANIVIFDQDLSPTQQRNLEDACQVKVIDRTNLILDIFAQRARTKEGKLQVELAQLKYILPRLVGRHRELSRLGGGIGTRGPGEKKLEQDRRRIKKRIGSILEELEKVKKHRSLYRTARKKRDIPVVALVGYTNAGKSTLLHALTGADISRENRLFSTLDPTTRRLDLSRDMTILITDTVGFIRHIPHQLVAAFKSTLEEVLFADVILHVIDISKPDFREQIQVVRDVLAEIGAGDKIILEAFNKIDLVEDQSAIEKIRRRNPEAIVISAKKRLFLDGLLIFLDDALKRNKTPTHNRDRYVAPD